MSSTADGSPPPRLAELLLERAENALLDARGESRAEVLEAPRDVLLELVAWARRRGRRGGAGTATSTDSSAARGLLALEIVDGDLEDALRLVDPAQVPLADREHGYAVGQARAEERARRLREEDLPAAADGADAGRAHDVEPDVALLVDRRLAGVQAHPHAHVRLAGPGLRRVRALSLDRGGHRVARAREREEERVALRVDLDPVARSERVADEASVRRQHVAVVVTEALEELRRVLDVGEHEGDRSAG